MTNPTPVPTAKRLLQIVGDMDSCKCGAVMEAYTTLEVAAALRALIAVRELAAMLRESSGQVSRGIGDELTAILESPPT